jgi:hypothetical protein
MQQGTLFKEDLELDKIRETQQQLLERQKEFAENQKRIAHERAERESMIPPLDEIQLRKQRKEHESFVNRGLITNARRTQNRSLAMLFLLLLATASLIWWGLQLMQGV